MLKLKRIDAVMVNRAVFENAAKQGNIPVSHFNAIKHSAHPVSMYIQKQYIKNHLHVLKQINQAIQQHYPKLNCRL